MSSAFRIDHMKLKTRIMEEKKRRKRKEKKLLKIYLEEYVIF